MALEQVHIRFFSEFIFMHFSLDLLIISVIQCP